jgi:hypothetical protein
MGVSAPSTCVNQQQQQQQQQQVLLQNQVCSIYGEGRCHTLAYERVSTKHLCS